MTLRLGFDLDGVLADFRSGFETMVRRFFTSGKAGIDSPDESPRALTAAELKRVWDRIAAVPNWWTSLAPYEPDQILRLYNLTHQHRWEVYFLTKRPESAGESVQFQTQWWLERHGYLLPSVLTVPGSRGELANALRLDLVIDDQFVNCVEVVSASAAKALLMLRATNTTLRDHATSRGIGVVSNLGEALDVLERLREILPERKGRLVRLADWFSPKAAETQLDVRTRPTIEGDTLGEGKVAE